MAWFDATYGYKKKITLDNTKVAGDETDFPVLISVTDNNLRDEANGGHVKHASGYDIIFTNSAEDTQLKHEIELYINTSGLLVYWVKVPSISSTPPSTDIYIYYGKAGVGADPSTTDTWDANFKAVYHMDDAAGACDDSTVNVNDGTYAGNLPDKVTGKIGYGQDFDGSGDWIVLPAGAYLTTLGTVEMWTESDDPGGWRQIWHSFEDGNNYINFQYDGNMDAFSTGKSGGVNQWDLNVTGTGVAFHYISLAWQTNDAYLVRDNVDTDIDGACAIAAFSPTSSRIGSNEGGAVAFDGVIDEVRLSNIRRSNNWLNTTYETQDDPAGFLSWGAEETPSVATGADIFYHDGTNNIELQRDDSSPVQMFNGTSVIGLKLGATDDGDASPFHVFDGTNIKAILKMP